MGEFLIETFRLPISYDKNAKRKAAMTAFRETPEAGTVDFDDFSARFGITTQELYDRRIDLIELVKRRKRLKEMMDRFLDGESIFKFS